MSSEQDKDSVDKYFVKFYILHFILCACFEYEALF